MQGVGIADVGEATHDAGMGDAAVGQPSQRYATCRDRGGVTVLVCDVLESGHQVVVGRKRPSTPTQAP